MGTMHLSATVKLLMLANWLMLRNSSKGLLCSSHSIVNSVVYLCTKFVALNPRIHEIRSSGNWFQPVPQVQTRRFSIPTIFWLSNLGAMFPRASGTIMNSSLHVYSHSYASRIRVMEQAQTETQRGKFHKKYVSLPVILILSTIFTAAVGRILTNSQLCIL